MYHEKKIWMCEKSWFTSTCFLLFKIIELLCSRNEVWEHISVSHYYFFFLFSSLKFFVRECSHRNYSIHVYEVETFLVWKGMLCRGAWSCMHVGASDARELRNSIAITFPIFNISLLNLRYRCILKLPSIWYCQISMKSRACMWVCVMHVN